VKIFITGGTGFIGKHVLQRLLNSDLYENTVLTRQKLNDQNNVTYIQGDICNPSLLNEHISRSDFVVHLAGCKNDLQSYNRVNVEGTRNVIDACVNNNRLKKLIYLSSVGVIGATDDIVIDERTDCHPQNNYERSKYQAELIVKAYSNKYPGKVVILRPTNVFGEKDPEVHLLNLLRNIINNRFYFVGNDISKCYLNYLYVKEISELIPRLLDAKIKNDLYILSTPIRLYDFIMTIKDILRVETPAKHLPYWPVRLLARCFDFVPNNIMRHPPINSTKLKELTNVKWYSSSLLSTDLNWNPAFKVEEALTNLISHYYRMGLLT
jgi:nucleoside-diphosphate-sugar epimerase